MEHAGIAHGIIMIYPKLPAYLQMSTGYYGSLSQSGHATNPWREP